MVAVYADESCLGNGREGDNPGGAGGLIEYRGASATEPTLLDYWLSEPATTNNKMALRSAIEADASLKAAYQSLADIYRKTNDPALAELKAAYKERFGSEMK